MCFSAQSSFILSGVLATIGYLTIKKTQNKSQLYLASIPYLFAIQQFTEGILWLILTNKVTADLKDFTIYLYLFFAILFWPIFIPLSIIKLEKNKTRLNLLYFTLVSGLLNFIYGLYSIIRYGVNVSAQAGHIDYQVFIPCKFIYGLLYLIAVILPFFISSINLMRYFGILLIFSIILSIIAYYNFFISVWCFFAAILSIAVYWIVTKS